MKILNVRPVGDKLLVRPIPPEEISRGGIIIPDNAKKPTLMGIVVAAGPGRHSEAGELLPNPVQQGDKILYHRFAGTEVKAGEAAILMTVDDVLAVVDPGIRRCWCLSENKTGTEAPV